jgi:hypothetical protein
MTQNDYLNKCAELIKQKIVKEQQYSNLHQIDMLSGEGNQLQKEINILEGEIKSLKWVLGLTSII